MKRTIQPKSWKEPRGYSNAIAARGDLVFIAGQIGWNESETIVSSDFAEQAAQALRNIAEILREAGGTPGDLVRLTWYVTDKHEYRAARKRLGTLYREILGDAMPAMALVQVGALLEDEAKVEIEATAVIGNGAQT